MPTVLITSTTNPRIKQLARLLDHPSHRRADRLFLVESPRDFHRAVAAGFTLLELYLQPDLDPPTLAAAIDASGRDHPALFHITPEVNRKIAIRENPTGLVALFSSHRPDRSLDDLLASPSSAANLGPVLVLSGLEKPGNIGAIMRSADAAGAAAILIDQPDADVFNPNAIRASTGAVFTVPTICATAQAIAASLRQHHWRIVAATPESAVDVYGLDLTGRMALVLGAEAEGLSDFWRAAADERVAIPMRGQCADSLNVSVTAAVLLFESLRQRIHRAR
jgi:TrmH family RNA methyltransferase